MLDKAYIRFRENIPDNANTYAAAEGFHIQGIPVVPFYGFGDLNPENMPDLGPHVIVCGNIGDVWEALKMMGKVVPGPVDYPAHLDWMLGRKVEETTLAAIRASTGRRFIKPRQQKLFGGFVYDALDPLSRLAVAVYPEETLCFASEEVEFVSEYRCFVKNDMPVGVKHYRGDPFTSPSKAVYNKALKCNKGKMPAAYAMDLGVTADGQTLLVEVNDGHSVGSYGLTGLVYARFLEARWEQMAA